MIVLYTKSLLISDDWVEIGRTEVVKDNLNPHFQKPFVVEYVFEEEQKLKFIVADVNGDVKPSEKESLGFIETTLAKIVCTRGQIFKKNLIHPYRQQQGSIKIVSEEVIDEQTKLTFHFEAKNLEKKDFFGKSDPFYQISRIQEDQSYTLVHRSEPIMKTLSPIWPQLDINLGVVCGSDVNRKLLVEVYDWNKSGAHELIGSFETTFKKLTAKIGGEFELSNEKNEKSKKILKAGQSEELPKICGIFIVKKFQSLKMPSFLDYVNDGMQLNFTVAIDFTSSNGDPLKEDSLHYCNPYKANDYQQAIMSIGSILEDYDSDKTFPVYGFGAQIQGELSHCFPLTRAEGESTEGMEGLLKAYNYFMRDVNLSEPTHYAPLINSIATKASNDLQKTGVGIFYSVLLIITDGEVNDMEQTIKEIINASTLPFAIIIIGVGKADFSKMIFLDSDNKTLATKDGKKRAARDIVQFVPFRDYIGVRSHKLAKAVLAEIPDQIIEYMTTHGVFPKGKKPKESESVMSLIDQCEETKELTLLDMLEEEKDKDDIEDRVSSVLNNFSFSNTESEDKKINSNDDTSDENRKSTSKVPRLSTGTRSFKGF
ncbi:Copine-8, partial [Clydaea vesicula]